MYSISSLINLARKFDYEIEAPASIGVNTVHINTKKIFK